jgi:hypothetical protein
MIFLDIEKILKQNIRLNENKKQILKGILARFGYRIELRSR